MVVYYILFDRYTDKLQVFQLEGGQYQPQVLRDSKVWLPQLELGIGLWNGVYNGLRRQ